MSDKKVAPKIQLFSAATALSNAQALIERGTKSD
jgi:hypothetical protein